MFTRGEGDDAERYLPLYEAKLFHQYDHRFATFEGADEQALQHGNAIEMPVEQKADPDAVVIPRYWVPAEEVIDRLSGPDDAAPPRTRVRPTGRPRSQLALRNIVRSTDERTGIGTMIPGAGIGNSGTTILIG